eukprot:g33814.t1
MFINAPSESLLLTLTWSRQNIYYVDQELRYYFKTCDNYVSHPPNLSSLDWYSSRIETYYFTSVELINNINSIDTCQAASLAAFSRRSVNLYSSGRVLKASDQYHGNLNSSSRTSLGHFAWLFGFLRSKLLLSWAVECGRPCRWLVSSSSTRCRCRRLRPEAHHDLGGSSSEWLPSAS